MAALHIADRVAEALLSLKRVGDPPSVIKSRSIDIVVYRAKPDDLGGKKISEGAGGVELPSKDVLFGNNSNLPFVDFQVRFICLFFVCLFIYLLAYLFLVCLFICLLAYLFFVCLFVCLLTCSGVEGE